MNRKVCAILATVLFTTVCGLQALATTKVHAQAALCFRGTLDQSAPLRAVDCTELAVFIQAQFHTDPQPDTCYAQYDLLPQSKPLSACQDWIQQAGVTATSLPKCTAVNAKMADWEDGKVKDITKINVNANCSDYYGKLTTNGGGSSATFQNGQCYILFTSTVSGKYDFTTGTCDKVLAALVSHQQMTGGDQVFVDAERKDVIACDGRTTNCLAKNPLVQTANKIIDFISVGIAVIVVVMIIVGGIQYASAGNNPQAVSAAKKRISNALLALVAFMLLYAFMTWLIPGGPF